MRFTFVSGSFSKGNGRGFISSFGVSGIGGFTSGVGGCSPGVEGAGILGVAGVPDHKEYFMPKYSIVSSKFNSALLSLFDTIQINF